MKPYGVTMSEAQLQEAVIDCAHTFGWLIAHFRPARVKRGGVEIYETPVAADGKGFPDLVMLRGRRMIAAELKSATGKLRPDQELWLAAFRALVAPQGHGDFSEQAAVHVHVGCHVETYVWEPSRWMDGTIERVLR